METLLDGVNHIAFLTRAMDRCMRFYPEVFDAHVCTTIATLRAMPVNAW